MTALLFVRAETSGLLRRNLNLADPAQPWIVALAAELVDFDGRSLAGFHTQIRADGRSITSGAANVHGITTRQAGREGISEVIALGMLVGMSAQIGHGGAIVAHHARFVRDVVTSILIRRDRKTDTWIRPGLAQICTAEASAPFVRAERGAEDDDERSPSLDEAVQAVCGLPARTNTRSVVEDLARVKQVYAELVKRRAIEAPEIGTGSFVPLGRAVGDVVAKIAARRQG